MSGHLLPHVLADWPALLTSSRSNQLPQLPRRGPIDEDQRRALVSYTRRLGPLKTADTTRIAAAMDDLVATNTDAVNGSRRVLLIDGPSAMGKSQAVIAHALRRSEDVWAVHGHRVNNAEVIPYVYLEVAAVGWARALMASLLQFAGIPAGVRESAPDMLRRFRHLAPVLGVKAVIVDDAHMLRTSSTESRQLTDFLKSVVSSLPVSFVFVGAGLRDSALLRQSTRGGYSAAEQIARRATVLSVAPWPHLRPTDGEPWTMLLASLEQLLHIPSGSAVGVLTNTTTCQLLHKRCEGHPGLVIDWVKRAAVRAIQTDRQLSRALLAETAPPRLAPP